MEREMWEIPPTGIAWIVGFTVAISLGYLKWASLNGYWPW
jgi:hypothetical protein